MDKQKIAKLLIEIADELMVDEQNDTNAPQQLELEFEEQKPEATKIKKKADAKKKKVEESTEDELILARTNLRRTLGEAAKKYGTKEIRELIGDVKIASMSQQSIDKTYELLKNFEVDL